MRPSWSLVLQYSRCCGFNVSAEMCFRWIITSSCNLIVKETWYFLLPITFSTYNTNHVSPDWVFHKVLVPTVVERYLPNVKQNILDCVVLMVETVSLLWTSKGLFTKILWTYSIILRNRILQSRQQNRIYIGTDMDQDNRYACTFCRRLWHGLNKEHFLKKHFDAWSIMSALIPWCFNITSTHKNQQYHVTNQCFISFSHCFHQKSLWTNHAFQIGPCWFSTINHIKSVRQ